MHLGLPTSSVFGNDEDFVHIVKKDLGNGLSCRVAITPESGYGDMYYQLITDGIPSTPFYLKEGETKVRYGLYNTKQSQHVVTVGCLGDWKTPPGDVTLKVLQEDFENSGNWLEINWQAVSQFVSHADNNQLSNWNITDFYRWGSGNLVPERDTEILLDVLLTLSSGVYTLQLLKNDTLIAIGTTNAPNASVSVSGDITGFVDLAYTGDLTTASASKLLIRYAKQYDVYANGVFQKTVYDTPKANSFSTRIGPLTPGSYDIQIQATSDTAMLGTISSNETVTVNTRPNPIPLDSPRYQRGSVSNCDVIFSGSTTTGCTYNVYQSELNAFPNMITPVTNVPELPLMTARLNPITVSGTGFVTVIVDSLKKRLRVWIQTPNHYRI